MDTKQYLDLIASTMEAKVKFAMTVTPHIKPEVYKLAEKYNYKYTPVDENASFDEDDIFVRFSPK